MKTIILYTSSTGFTKRYAEWLAERTGYEVFPLKEAKKMDLSVYDRFVYGGWIHAAVISGINDIMKLSEGKELFLFAVGGAPENDETMSNIKKALPEKLRTVPLTYCPGGFAYDKMRFGNKVMMKMFSGMVSGKKNKTEEEAAMSALIKESYDISDPKYIEALAEELRKND